MLPIDVHSVVENGHGSKASIYFIDSNTHQVEYTDHNGVVYFTEEYVHVDTKVVEHYVTEWTDGHREL